MGETDLFHDVGNADAVESRLSEPSRRRRDDLLPVFGHRLFAYLHRLPPPLPSLGYWMRPVLEMNLNHYEYHLTGYPAFGRFRSESCKEYRMGKQNIVSTVLTAMFFVAFSL